MKASETSTFATPLPTDTLRQQPADAERWRGFAKKPIPFPCTQTTATLLPPKRGSQLVSILHRNFERGSVSISLSLSKPSHTHRARWQLVRGRIIRSRQKRPYNSKPQRFRLVSLYYVWDGSSSSSFETGGQQSQRHVKNWDGSSCGHMIIYCELVYLT